MIKIFIINFFQNSKKTDSVLDTYGNELDETDENESGDDEMLLDKYLSNFIPDDLDGKFFQLISFSRRQFSKKIVEGLGGNFSTLYQKQFRFSPGHRHRDV